MKNPRALQITNEMVEKHKLNTNEPPPGSLFWKMWEECKPIAESALHTKYIQGIKNGTLHPAMYGAFHVSDAYYCFHGAGDYLIAEGKTNEPELKAYLAGKRNSYAKYNEQFSETWHIKDAAAITPTPVCKSYSDFESSVAANREPIYCIPVMLPCEYLWAWLAQTLSKSPLAPNNLYQAWINNNKNPSGAYAMGNFLNREPFASEIDDDKAIAIYKTAITYEYENFKSATENM